MNAVLWILAGILALAFLAAGGLKLTRPRSALKAQGMGWADDFSDSQVKGIGLIEVLGGIGLIVPAATGIAPVLTPLAALCLTLVMGGAVVVHLRRKETPLPPLILGLLALLLAILRFGPYSF